VAPDKHGRWTGNYTRHGRANLAEVGWLKSSVRHGVFVRWYQSGAKALEATYCNGVLQDSIRRWSEQGVPLDAGSGWLAPPDGGV